jgi:hypothetical protein
MKQLVLWVLATVLAAPAIANCNAEDVKLAEEQNRTLHANFEGPTPAISLLEIYRSDLLLAAAKRCAAPGGTEFCSAVELYASRMRELIRRERETSGVATATIQTYLTDKLLFNGACPSH